MKLGSGGRAGLSQVQEECARSSLVAVVSSMHSPRRQWASATRGVLVGLVGALVTVILQA